MSIAVPPIRRLAADGCPGALQLHEAADGGLARVRVPGGVVSRTQWAALHSAAPAGLELTSRANVQIRAVSPGTETALARQLAAVGLLPSATHERVRNILASPLSFSPLVAALDAGLCADPELASLPGRFLFALDDGSGDVSGLGADAGIFPVGPGVLALLLAGVDSGLRVGPEQAVPALLGAARGFLAERGAQASGAWRLSELEDGVARVTARVHAFLHAVPSTTVGGPARWPIPASALVPRTAGPLGTIPQPEGRVAVGVVAPLGRLTAQQAVAIESVARRYGSAFATPPSGSIVITPWRGVIIPGLSPADAPAALAELDAAGLVTDPASPWATASACTGRPGCAKALADVRADAATALHALEPAEDLRPMHWVGCERRCGRPAGAAVEVLAVAGGYRVGGKTYRIDELPAVLAAARRNS